MFNVTEQYVLEHCLHNPEQVLKEVFFPQFKDELEKVVPLTCVPGLVQPVQAIKPMTFDEWKKLRYRELRRVAYGDWHDQMEMQANGTWEQHIKDVKAKWPKDV